MKQQKKSRQVSWRRLTDINDTCECTKRKRIKYSHLMYKWEAPKEQLT